MSDRLRVYVAGPISLGDITANIKQATEAGIELLRAGFAPLVPQLSAYMAGPTPEAMPAGTTHADWMGVDLPWVMVSDALLRLPGESKGADMEVAMAKSVGVPVYESVAALAANPPARGDSRFHALLERIGNLHDAKQADYGTGGDPFANVRASEQFGIPAWVGAVLRGNDKMARIKSFLNNGRLKNESVEDSLMDLAVYALIGLILYREKAGTGPDAVAA